MTPEQLRALCPTCHRGVRVKLRASTWRMTAHDRTVSKWNSSRSVACPVRDVDAGPLIAAWFEREQRDLDRRETTAEAKRVEGARMVAAAEDETMAVRERRETLAALRALVLAEGARP